MFYADSAPPIEVTVLSNSPTWLAWLPIGISLLSLAISASQFYMSRAERRRVMPAVKVSASFLDRLYSSRKDDVIKAVMITVDNLGRESTTLSQILIASKTCGVNGLNCLIDERDQVGDGRKRLDPPVQIAGFARAQFIVDAEMIKEDDILVAAAFGHGLRITLSVHLNGPSSSKPLTERQIKQHESTLI
ncbi:hypothetical protein P3H80_12265 [Mycolicibacterium septicum]|uniref:hypothetical protein n=1 Tax=Mycolicibacterium septicum TaxID=98668 RepID=UPI0023E0E784|nr:hypothetical protein [Mycolicibacterium septicum]MDF3338202.1 hypothetical protein [Mycolicibacterium septicum]